MPVFVFFFLVFAPYCLYITRVSVEETSLLRKQAFITNKEDEVGNFGADSLL